MLRNTMITMAHSMVAVLVTSGCAGPDTQSNDLPPQLQDRAEVVAQAMHAGSAQSSVSVTQLAANVAHYTFEIRVGDGAYDIARVHRVVRLHKGRPERTKDAIFLDHGDFSGFESAFLTNALAESASADDTLPVYLAKHGVDVWGIDHGWTLVPDPVTAATVFEGWGIQKDIDHMRTTLAFARLIRLLSGNGGGRFTLLGWSAGSVRAYAYANAEAVLPKGARHVDKLIPVDQYPKTDNPVFQQGMCGNALPHLTEMNAGNFVDTLGSLGPVLGSLARQDGASPSPVFPGFTNKQAAHFFGQQTYALVAPVSPVFHFVGGSFDANGLPADLHFTSHDTFYTYLETWAPTMPQQVLFEEYALACPDFDLPFDDNFGAIKIPVLTVGANGGFGDTMEYTLSLLGTKDKHKTFLSVSSSSYPEAEDMGHFDLFGAPSSKAPFWRQVLRFVRN